ncbi:MAG TPA: sulfur oxidation protein SoxY, partial [Burkholderiales bacterium]|nr:sulfur oxidation protein SoxY [Burkholderiales bacterium]
MKRRAFLFTVFAFPVLSRADPREAREAIAKLVGNAQVNKGKVTLELPQLVENGNSVSMSVKVDSP